ncbi:hypothetical protein BGZ98_000284 [Dissophora globulifera]|nr:hypothetical protein BGZ98_000284 [Dissophora globulifera]
MPQDKHDRNACYVRITLDRQHDPLTVVFNRYNMQHNYLEFVQQSAPAVIEGSVYMTPGDATLGRLDLNLWEEQWDKTAASTAPRATRELSSISQGRGTPRSRVRRSSITEARVILGTEHQIQRELATAGPITPSPQAGVVRHTLRSAFDTSSLTAALPTSVAAAVSVPTSSSSSSGESYMARFARTVLASTGTGLQTPRTRPNMMAAELAQEALRLFHTVDNEVLAFRKQYKFDLSEGPHYIGDNDFIMRYTISFIDPILETSAATPTPLQQQISFKVDYIRASWRWITSGLPVAIKAKSETNVSVSDSSSNLSDPMAIADKFPQERIGKIYALRYNRILLKVQENRVSQHVRGELALAGYDVSILPRDFVAINLRSAPVLEWITRVEENNQAKTDQTRRMEVLQDDEPHSHLGVTVDAVPEDSSDSEWEDLSPRTKLDKGKDVMGVDAETLEDEEALEKLVEDMKQNMGFLTGRDILEEMLASQGLARELCWKYGIVRREMMGAVPDPQQAKQWLQKIADSEAANSAFRR